MKSGDLVLIDTNAIIEAVRTGCWSAIRVTSRCWGRLLLARRTSS
ncbi:hypothetical protein ACFL0I_02560 [Gemmatimonadota bacterium]